jgi:DNA-binding GntR family transcriptional regulator
MMRSHHDHARGTVTKGRAGPDEIADAVRAEILRGELPPGRPLRQEELAARFGVSRVPVREALRGLCSEGLALWQPQRGFTVSVLAPGEAREILEIRSVLERQGLRWAFAAIDDTTIRAAATILAEAEVATSIDAWSELNDRFHQTLLAPCGCSELLGLVRQLNNRVDRYIRLLVARADYRRRAEKEHRAILAAIDAKSCEAAALLLDAHIAGTSSALDAYLADWQGGSGNGRSPRQRGSSPPDAASRS